MSQENLNMLDDAESESIFNSLQDVVNAEDGDDETDELEHFLTENKLNDHLSLFRDQQIDFETLMILTETDLKSLGLPLGPFRKLLNALQKRKSEHGDESLCQIQSTPVGKSAEKTEVKEEIDLTATGDSNDDVIEVKDEIYDLTASGDEDYRPNYDVEATFWTVNEDGNSSSEYTQVDGKALIKQEEYGFETYVKDDHDWNNIENEDYRQRQIKKEMDWDSHFNENRNAFKQEVHEDDKTQIKQEMDQSSSEDEDSSSENETEVKEEIVSSDELDEEERYEDDSRQDLYQNHPYRYDLDHFQLGNEFKYKENVQGRFFSLEEKPFVLVRDDKDWVSLIQSLRQEKQIAIECKYANGLAKKLCTMQISTPSTDYLIDVIKVKRQAILITEIFVNPNILKIFYDANEHVKTLQKFFSIFTINVFCVRSAAIALKHENPSFAQFIRRYDTYKAPRNYEYKNRPLARLVKVNLRKESHYLLRIYRQFRNDLIDRNLLDWHADEGKRICSRLYTPPLDRKADELLASYGELNVAQQAVADHLNEWRRSCGIRLGIEAEKVLSENKIVQLCMLLPKTPTELYKICGYAPHIVDGSKVILRRTRRARRHLQISTKPLKAVLFNEDKALAKRERRALRKLNGPKRVKGVKQGKKPNLQTSYMGFDPQRYSWRRPAYSDVQMSNYYSTYQHHPNISWPTPQRCLQNVKIELD